MTTLSVLLNINWDDLHDYPVGLHNSTDTADYFMYSYEMQNYFYKNTLPSFCNESIDVIVGILTNNSSFDVTRTQRDAWIEQITLLQSTLHDRTGSIYFEYTVPRLGRRIDVVILTGSVIYVIEFKVGEHEYNTSAIEQVWDYALDLKNFHSTSHHETIAPILVVTNAKEQIIIPQFTTHNDQVLIPIMVNAHDIKSVLTTVEMFTAGKDIKPTQWETGRYSPTPTIVEAARALYSGNSVENIARNDSGAINLTKTTAYVSEVIKQSKAFSKKSICFVTGVPGAGKTLVGLDVAHKHLDKDNDLYSVYLSGNGPLVSILREALARDRANQNVIGDIKITKKDAYRDVSLFIQNVHHFRDDCLRDLQAPIEHVALFDEAQRAWNKEQTINFMRRKKNQPHFSQSEPEFLISCLDRHKDWATIVCLVGGGQEIHTGEGGITEWVSCLQDKFPHWHMHISSRLTDEEYGAGAVIEAARRHPHVTFSDDLHLAISMRSFRTEHVSALIKQILDQNVTQAKETLKLVSERYPIVITRDIHRAKEWLKTQARGSERYGMMVSSQAERLRPHAIFVKASIDPIHWFLDDKNDVRSSYYLEDVVTEFDVQGLELDWTCVVWDGDFRYGDQGWEHNSFRGNKWQRINKAERKQYQKNAYRVLLTRARQGMVIVIPNGSREDPTRNPHFYDPTFNYLKSIGFKEI